MPEGHTPAEIIVIDPSEPALALAAEMGADHTVKLDGKQVDTVKELTDGLGAEAIIDFVGEKGAIEDGIAMVRDGGFYYVIGYGENINVPTIDVISREICFIGNLVGTYTDLVDLMTLTAEGKVSAAHLDVSARRDQRRDGRPRRRTAPGPRDPDSSRLTQGPRRPPIRRRSPSRVAPRAPTRSSASPSIPIARITAGVFENCTSR